MHCSNTFSQSRTCFRELFLLDGSWFNIDTFLNIIRQKLQNIMPKPAVEFSFDSSCLKCVYLRTRVPTKSSCFQIGSFIMFTIFDKIFQFLNNKYINISWNYYFISHFPYFSIQVVSTSVLWFNRAFIQTHPKLSIRQ